MSYRLLKKTTKKTEHKCLNCDNCEKIKRSTTGYLIKCNHPDVKFKNPFFSGAFTCFEYYSITKITKDLVESLKPKRRVKNKFELKGEDAQKYKQKSIFEISLDNVI